MVLEMKLPRKLLGHVLRVDLDCNIKIGLSRMDIELEKGERWLHNNLKMYRGSSVGDQFKLVPVEQFADAPHVMERTQKKIHW